MRSFSLARLFSLVDLSPKLNTITSGVFLPVWHQNFVHVFRLSFDHTWQLGHPRHIFMRRSDVSLGLVMRPSIFPPVGSGGPTLEYLGINRFRLEMLKWEAQRKHWTKPFIAEIHLSYAGIHPLDAAKHWRKNFTRRPSSSRQEFSRII